MATADDSRRWRDKARGGPPRALRPCGTLAAYRRHVRRGEAVCAVCARAWADYIAARRRGVTGRG